MTGKKIIAPKSAPIGEHDIAEVARAAIKAAVGGDMYGAEVARRLWRECRRSTVTLDLPPIDTLDNIAAAQAAVIEAAARGRIAPREALAFSTMIEYRRRAIETLSLEVDLRRYDAEARQRKATGWLP